MGLSTPVFHPPAPLTSRRISSADDQRKNEQVDEDDKCSQQHKALDSTNYRVTNSFFTVSSNS